MSSGGSSISVAGPLPRLVEIADDQGYRREVPLTDLPQDRCVVLLGDPGLGKTTALQALADCDPMADFIPVRHFLSLGTGQARSGRTLYLDALDEAIAAGASDPLGAAARGLVEAGSPRFLLSCRPADWAAVAGRSLLQAVAGSRRLLVARLLPLSFDQVEDLVRTMMADPDAILPRLRDSGIGPLVENPQTLELVLKVAASGGGLPASRLELFKRAIELLAVETRKDAPHPPELTGVPAASILDAAGAACASLLIGDRDEISLMSDPVADGVNLHDLVTDASSYAALRAALSTRLFLHVQPGRWRPPHRTVAEFLAARFLSDRIAHRGLPLSRVLALLCGANSAPHPALRGVFAWLPVLLPGEAARLVARDPYGVAAYGAADSLPIAARRAMLEGLAALAEREPYFRAGLWDGVGFGALGVPELVPELRAVLARRPVGVHLLSCALDAVVAGEPLPALVPDLLAFTEDPALPLQFRMDAVPALVSACGNDPAPAVALFHRLLADPARDSSSSLASTLLVALYPAHLSVNDLTTFLRRYLDKAICGCNARERPHLDYDLVRRIPPGSEHEILDAISTALPKDGERVPEGRADAVGDLAAALLTRVIPSLSISEAPRVAKWSQALRLRAGRGSAGDDLDKALGTRPDLFLPVLIATAELDDPALRPNGIFHACHRLRQSLPSWTWPTDAFQQLARAALSTDDEREAMRLLAAAHQVADWQRPDELALLPGLAAAAEQRAGLAHEHDEMCRPQHWTEWQIENAVRRKRHREKDRQARQETNQILRSAIEKIRTGEEINGLMWIGEVWFGIVNREQTIGLPPSERLRDAVLADVADAAEQGLRAFASRGSIPPPSRLAELALSSKVNRTTRPLLAGADLLFADAGIGLPDLDPDRMALLLCVALMTTTYSRHGNTERADERAWVARVAAAHPSAVASSLRALLIPQLAAGADDVQGLYQVCMGEGFGEVRALLLADLLEATSGQGAPTMLIRAALRDLDGPVVRSWVERSLREGAALEPTERWRRLVLAWRLDPIAHEQDVRNAVQSEPNPLADLAVAAGESMWGGGDAFPDPPLSLAHRALLIRLAGPRWPPAPMPLSSWSPPTAYDFGDFVARQISRVGATPGPEAGTLLAGLVADPALAAHGDALRHALAVHSREERRRAWASPSPGAVAAVLRDGPPATGPDLRAFVEAHLRDLGARLRTTGDNLWRGFWNTDGAGNPTGPKAENVCRDHVVGLLRTHLQQGGLTAETEGRFPVDDRCDIVAGALGRILPVEVKGDWHKELWTAWSTQLGSRYASHPDAGGLGIYLVVWCGPKRGDGSPLRTPPDGSAPPTAAGELESRLQRLIDEEGLGLRAVVLDASPVPRHGVPRAACRERPAQKLKRGRTGAASQKFARRTADDR